MKSPNKKGKSKTTSATQAPPKKKDVLSVKEFFLGNKMAHFAPTEETLSAAGKSSPDLNSDLFPPGPDPLSMKKFFFGNSMKFPKSTYVGPPAEVQPPSQGGAAQKNPDKHKKKSGPGM